MTDEPYEDEQPDESVTAKELGRLIDGWLNDARPERYDEDDKEWMAPVVALARETMLRASDEAITDAAKRRVHGREGTAVRETNRILRDIAKTGQLPLGWGDGPEWMTFLYDILRLPLKIGGNRVRLGVASPNDLEQWQLENSREEDQDKIRRINARKGARLLAEWQTQQGVHRVDRLKPPSDES